MRTTFSEDLLLTNAAGKHLYETYARHLPIIDYHCHLLPEEIRENRRFTDLGEMWLARDHYKWRAMRAFGIDERLITGAADYHDKYLAFAGILPRLAGNPIYIWCALELKRFFGIDEPLGPDNAEAMYRRTAELIREKNMTPRWCMEISNVEMACTTEDPTDDLKHHIAMRGDPSLKVNVLSAFRPDKAFYCEKEGFRHYVERLAASAETRIERFPDLVAALDARLIFFKNFGCMVSDNGIEDFLWRDFTPGAADAVFRKALAGQALAPDEIALYRSAFLAACGELYHRRGFVMQLHIGTYQGGNRRGEKEVGVATGFDCVDDSTPVGSVGALLNWLNWRSALPKTILYPLDAGKIESFAILAGGFCAGGARATVQLGAPWWFNDQTFGLRRQFEAVANLYPLSLSVGMLTDSRSFLSYPRHELYRRVLCDYLGALVERGEYFSGEKELAGVIEDVCYRNARRYFGLGD